MVAIKDRPVHYLDELAGDYRRELSGARSMRGLKAVVTKWEPVAGDAVDALGKMVEADFTEFQRGLKMERRGKFAGEAWAERFSAILIPEMLLRNSVIAEEFGVPEGTALIRAVETGRFRKRDGRFYDTLAEKQATEAGPSGADEQSE